MLGAVVSLLALFPTAQGRSDTELAPAARPPLVLGHELPCRDLERAIAFYREALGYELARRAAQGAVMRLGEACLVLDATRAPADPEARSLAHVNYRTAELEAAAARVERSGGVLDPAGPQRFVLGASQAFRDSEGNRAQLVRLDAESAQASDLPLVFNLSVRSLDLGSLETFFCEGLGLRVYSRDYLPRTLPLERSGALALVLHAREAAPAEAAAIPGARILLAAGAWTDPRDAAARPPADRRSPLYGESTTAFGPEGLEVVLLRAEDLLPAAAAGD